MARIFISYDREDRDFAEVVQAKLERAGHETAMDFDVLNAGDDWQDRLDEEIRRSQALVVIVTPESKDSEYVAYEWAFALGAGVTVIPLELRVTPFPQRLGTLHRLDFKDRSRPWDSLLVEVAKAEAANPTTSVRVEAGAPAPVREAARKLDSLDSRERADAVRTLAAIEHPSAREVLVQALDHPVSDVRRRAALNFRDRTDPRLLPGLLLALTDPDSDGEDRRDFVARMEAIGPAAVPMLLDALGQAPDRLRGPLIEALGRIGEDAAVPALIGIVGDDRSGHRNVAAEALGRIGNPAAGPALLEALEAEGRADRKAAASSLGALRYAPALPRLLDHLDGDVREVRAAAATALGELGDPSAAPGLLAALGDEDQEVLSAAAGALAALDHREALPDLRRRLEERREIQSIGTPDEALMIALLRLGDVDAIAAIQRRLIAFRSGSYARVQEICDLMVGYGESGVETVIEVLREAHADSVRTEAAQALSRVPSEEARAALRKWRRGDS